MTTSINANSNTSQSATAERRLTSQVDAASPQKIFSQLSADTVSISNEVTDLQNLSQELPSSKSNKTTEKGNEVVRISSTIGQASSQGQLNNEQATKLYNEIAALL